MGLYVYLSAPPGSLPWLIAAVGVALIGQQVGGLVLPASYSGAVGAFLVVPFAMLASRIRSSPPAIVLMLAAFWALVPGALSFVSLSEAATGGAADVTTLGDDGGRGLLDRARHAGGLQHLPRVRQTRGARAPNSRFRLRRGDGSDHGVPMTATEPTTDGSYRNKLVAVEPGGNEFIAEEDRHGKPSQLFWTWTSPNLEFATIFVGVLAVAVYGMSFWQAVARHPHRHRARRAGALLPVGPRPTARGAADGAGAAELRIPRAMPCPRR